MSPRTLLLKLLRRCGLSAPDGRLLCLYRYTDEEFRELTGVLRDAAHVHWQIWPTQERACLPMCFCLYAAEWWRRNYESGPWAWHDLLEASGLGATIPRQRLYRIVHRGLTGGKRQMLSVAGQRAFLVTLACEGGVPLKLLHRDGTHLHRYFRALLREFQIYGQREVSSSALAARGRCVTGVDHLCNHREFGQFISNSIHTCDTVSLLDRIGICIFQLS